MSDIIKLLPDHIANQIAAGEVVQRPASVVKELIENAIDAGATKINLIAKDGGKTLIQIIDNGCGMSAIDARMSFERHATSKIATAEDLFLLQTKGFRGEALASIAAVAHVQMKTKLHDEELGTEIINEGSKIIRQEAVMASQGTSIAVKNLFFNIPARRNFLGKNTTEYRKVLDEFLRVALVHPDISFSFHHNDDEIYNLQGQGLRQRIVQIYGTKFNQRLVPVNEETDLIKISGFILKPEFAKASKDQSYFFVNNRYFKDRYFHHAVINAYEGLIPSGKFPPYFLYFEVPTQSIDVNVHPTKTEIKFEENQAIYAIIRSAVKQALGQFNIAPSLDFEQERSFDVPRLKKGESVKIPTIQVNPDFNPFKTTTASQSTGLSGRTSGNGFSKIQPQKSEWENFYGELDQSKSTEEKNEQQRVRTISSSMDEEMLVERKKPTQINDKYILTSIKQGFLLIDQYRAHCRILFDQLVNKEEHAVQSQKLIFAEDLGIDQTDYAYYDELIPQLNDLGFELHRNEASVSISAVPVDLKDKNPKKTIVEIIENYKSSEQNSALDTKEKIALSMASAMATKGGNKLTGDEMEYLTDALFASSSPQLSPHGKKIIETFTLEEITKRFN
jgi:DNA mismatch repair protein MutL